MHPPWTHALLGGETLRGSIAMHVVRAQPFRLGVDARETHPVAITPGTLDHVGRAPEIGDHLARAAAGHTLPRPVRLLGLTFAVGLLARHEAMTLAFRG